MDLIYIFFGIILTIVIFLYIIIKRKIFYYKNFVIKIYKYDEITNSHIDDMKKISLNCTGVIPNNPIFNYINRSNKILLLIYKNKKPIAFNLMFNYKYNNFTCLHCGLTLIDKDFQGQGIKNITILNPFCYLMENLDKNIYVSNLGNLIRNEITRK